jgi:multicomponent Na+:H+ antiporter subunit B
MTGAALLYGTLDMPRYGDPAAPIHVHPIAHHYTQVSPEESGIPNMVTTLLAYYRGFDTLGETAVVFTAGIGVLALIGRRRHKDGLPMDPSLGPDFVAERHIIVRIVGKLMIPLILLFACYVQAHGDYGPGGGFQAGVIFASGLMLYMLLFGIDAAERLVPPAVLQRLIALGLLLFGGVGVLNMLQGGQFLDYRTLADDPRHGIHYGVVAIELGVGITVTAVITSIIFTFTAYLRRGAVTQEA